LQNNFKMEVEHRPPVEATRQASGPESASRSWLRYAIPSSTDLIFVILLVGLSTGPLSTALLGDGGTGWHIRTGEWILRSHSVPRVDLFSTTMQGQPWYAWEWLYDAIVGTLHRAAGLNGVVLFTAFAIALTFALLLKRVLARASLPTTVILLLLAFSASTVHFLARPHVVSWLFTLVWCEALEAFEATGNSRTLLGLPLMMIIWVNVHGGFLIGLMLLGIYLLSNVVMASVVGDTSAPARAWTLSGLGFASLMASLANPHGYNLYVHIVHYLGDRFLMHHIEEFLRPDFHSVAQRCFAGLILVAVVTMAVLRRRMALRRWLILIFAIASGLYAVRNIPMASILIVWIAAPELSASLRDWANHGASDRTSFFLTRFALFSDRMTRFDQTLCGHLWPALILLGAVLLCISGGSSAGSHVMNARFDEKRFPVQSVDYLTVHGDGQSVFTMDRWGGYLIYRFYPIVVTAVDDRHDLYGSEFLKNYLKIMHGETGWDLALEKLHPGWVVVPADSHLAALLRQSPSWESAQRDNTAELFRIAVR